MFKMWRWSKSVTTKTTQIQLPQQKGEVEGRQLVQPFRTGSVWLLPLNENRSGSLFHSSSSSVFIIFEKIVTAWFTELLKEDNSKKTHRHQRLFLPSSIESRRPYTIILRPVTEILHEVLSSPRLKNSGQFPLQNNQIKRFQVPRKFHWR